MVEQSREDLIKHLRRLADLELEYSLELKTLSERLKHPVLKLLLEL